MNKYTVEQITAEAQRAARENVHDGVFDIPEGNLSPMISELFSNEMNLFLKVWTDELLRLNREWRANQENTYLNNE